MNEEQRRILQMVQDGVITAVDAQKLLAALEGESPTPEHSPPEPDMIATESPPLTAEPEAAMAGEVISSSQPNFDRFRTFWQYPFFIATGIFLIFALWLAAAFSATSGAFTLGITCLLGIVVVAALVMGLAWWSRTAKWVHVRVQSTDGDRVRISMPLSTRLMSFAFHISRNFVDEETREYITLAEGLITTMEQDPEGTPMMVDIDDDGDKVQVYIG